MMIQLKSPPEKKTSGPGDKIKNTAFTTNNQPKKKHNHEYQLANKAEYNHIKTVSSKRWRS